MSGVSSNKKAYHCSRVKRHSLQSSLVFPHKRSALSSRPHPKGPLLTTDLIDWRYIRRIVMEHRRDLLMAQGLAILAALMAVPVPLLLPLLVDEVLLQHPGFAVRWMDRLFPAEWHGPLSYILALLGLTLLLRILAALFNVLQTRAFSLLSKDII